MTKAELEAENASLQTEILTLKRQLAALVPTSGAEAALILPEHIHKGLAVARRMIKDGKRLAGFAFSRNDMALVDAALGELEAMKPAPTEEAPAEDDAADRSPEPGEDE